MNAIKLAWHLVLSIVGRLVLLGAVSLATPHALAADAPASASSAAAAATATTTADQGGVTVKGQPADPWTRSDERMRRLTRGLPCVGCDAKGDDAKQLPSWMQWMETGFKPPTPPSDADKVRQDVVTEQAHPENLTP